MTSPGSHHYTGKTKNMASHRFTGHRSDLSTGKVFKAVANHFNEPGHKLSDMRFLPFEVVQSNDPMVLAARETYWIEKKELLEFGINRRK